MCKVVEDMRNESVTGEKRMTVLRMLAAGKYTLKEIAAILGLSLEKDRNPNNQVPALFLCPNREQSVNMIKKLLTCCFRGNVRHLLVPDCRNANLTTKQSRLAAFVLPEGIDPVTEQ